MEKFEALISAFPPIPLSSKQLAFAGRIGLEARRYACFALTLSILLAIPISFLVFPPHMLVPAALLVSALTFLLMLMVPRFIFNLRVSRMEAELPFSLRMLGFLLEMRVPFAESLSVISKGKSPLSQEFMAMEREVRRGASIPSSLAHLASRLHSIPIRRALLSVSSAYSKGRAGEDLIRVSNGLLSLQKHAMKSASSRQSILSLLFMAVAVIFPAFLIIFSSLGRVSPLGGFEPSALPFIMLVLVPAASAALLALAASLSTPSFFSPKFQLRVFIPAFVATAAFVLLPAIIPRFLMFLLLATAASVLSYPMYLKEKRREKIEETLPDVILTISSQPPGLGLEPILSSMEKYSMPPLREEAAISLKQARANVKSESVLEDLWRRNGSLLLKRFSDLLSHALGAGHDISRCLSMLADDLLSSLEMRRERENLLSMQKYTLISGALLLPFIIGSALALSSEFGEEAQPAGLSTIPASYLAVYSFLSAAFISYAEGRPSSFIKYFAFLSVCGIALFHLFSGVPLW